MISKAILRYARVSPRKTRMVASLVRGRYAEEAVAILRNVHKRAAGILIKVLNSAIANSRRLPNIKEKDLYISKLFIDGGPVLKRHKAQAMGRASMIRRRTSHIHLELDIKEPKQAGPVKPVKKESQKKADKAKSATLRPRAVKKALKKE